MQNQNPEQQARDAIDENLRQAGWVVQKYGEHNIAAGPGVAVCEYPMREGHGTADYLLYLDRRVVGVIEAKKSGVTLTGVEVQTEKYSTGLPSSVPAVRRPLPFLYQSSGVETFFTNSLDPEPQAREVFTFHRPETLRTWAESVFPKSGAPPSVAEGESSGYKAETTKTRLKKMPQVANPSMRACQIEAITNLERSLADGKRRSLIQMQTGSGKTYTAVAQSYRLIKFAKARKILFLVDRSNLARQTLAEFQQYDTPHDGRKFTDLYNVQHLKSNQIDPAAKLCLQCKLEPKGPSGSWISTLARQLHLTLDRS
jgi:type I restriction enzyme R subunit